jgi:hypothetical protein
LGASNIELLSFCQSSLSFRDFDRNPFKPANYPLDFLCINPIRELFYELLRDSGLFVGLTKLAAAADVACASPT